MKTRLLIGGVVPLMVLVLAGLAQAQSEEERRDRQAFDNLRAELQQVELLYSTAVGKGVQESKDAGKATVETRSRVLMLVEKRDRLEDRISLLALRWGFDLSQPVVPAAPTTQPAPASSPEDALFARADAIIRAALNEEAKKTAEREAKQRAAEKLAEEVAGSPSPAGQVKPYESTAEKPNGQDKPKAR